MDSGAHTSFNAEDRSYFAILKKEIHNMSLAAGFSEKRAGELDIIVAEMTSNLVKHGGGGEVLAKIIHDDKNTGIEVISIDNGPGMTDPLKMMEDGMSTANTLGHGLGSMQRLSDVFQVYSLKDWGTIVLCRLYKSTHTRTRSPKPLADVKALVVAKPGETLCGDGAFYEIKNNRLKLMLGDGLGHGPDAHAAVQKAIGAFRQCDEENPVEILRFIHKEVKKTRGLVASAASYSFKEKKWQLCGIGNISTRTQNYLSGKTYIAYNGIVGLNIPNSMKEQEIPLERNQLIIMCSDGIKTRWELQKYIGIFRYDLSVLAAAIYKDFGRQTDDMSILVCRINT